MNGDVRPWMQTCALDVRRLVVIDRATTENIKTIIARHAPKVDVKAIASESAKAVYIDLVNRQLRKKMDGITIESIQKLITAELERALNHGE